MNKPLVTFILLSYNSEGFIEAAVDSALRQSYQPLEVLISDDCSTDATFAVARGVVDRYAGRHTVRLLKTDKNLGLGAHLNLVVDQARGEWFVVAAGDDISRPERVERLMCLIGAAGANVCAAFSSAELIDETGSPARSVLAVREPTIRTVINMNVGVSGATGAYRRSVFDFFGPLDQGLSYEDIVLCVRALLLGTVIPVSEPLVQYRRHERAQSTSGYDKTGEALRAHHTHVTLKELRAFANILRDLSTFAARRGAGDPAWREAMRSVCTAIGERDAWLDAIVGDSMATMVSRQLLGAPRRFARSVRLWLPFWLRARRKTS